MDTEALLHEREEKDTFFRNHPQSPLTSDQQAQFTGLSYYDPNPDLHFLIEAEEFEDKEDLMVQTNTGEVRDFQQWGKVHFSVGDEEAELVLLYSPGNGYFFLPFMDVTSGEETYGAGRYLDPPRLDDGRFLIDFNRAYSPLCAYNARWSCPIPPAENRLKVRIEAGEKKPDESWAEGY
jgi:hypothetical protein